MTIKKVIAIMLVITTIATSIFALSFQSSALTIDGRFPSSPIYGYTLSSASKSAVAYSNSSLTNKVGYIYGSDDCKILKVYTNNVVKCVVPWSGYSNGRTVYTTASSFFNLNFKFVNLTAYTKTAAYTRSDLKTKKGSVYVGDKCIGICKSGDYYLVICPWNSTYRLVWTHKSAFQKPSSSSSSSANTYSISNNIITLKGVKLSDYPVGSKGSNTYYWNVNGKSTYLGAKQCYGFCCWVEYRLHGSCYHTNSSRYPNLSGSVGVKNLTVEQLKSLINRAGPGAHLRTKNNGHSQMVLGVTNSGFTIADCNYYGDLKIRVKTYTWSEYLNYNNGFAWIEVYK